MGKKQEIDVSDIVVGDVGNVLDGEPLPPRADRVAALQRQAIEYLLMSGIDISKIKHHKRFVRCLLSLVDRCYLLGEIDGITQRDE